jgi:hypothetical protein
MTCRPTPPDFAEASRHIYRLRDRIFDDELRKLVGDLRVQMGLGLFAASERLERHSFNSASGLSNEAHDRMHVLLQQHL